MSKLIELKTVTSSIGLEIERSEAQIGRCFTPGEKAAFEIAYLAGYSVAMHYASEQSAQILGDVKAWEESVKANPPPVEELKDIVP